MHIASPASISSIRQATRLVAQRIIYPKHHIVSSLGCIPPPRAEILQQKLLKSEEAHKLEIIKEKMEVFKCTFPEIADLCENELVRDNLLDCEELSWPRGNEYRDRTRELSPKIKSYIRRRINEIIIHKQKEGTLTDEVVIFLEGYINEKKSW